MRFPVVHAAARQRSRHEDRSFTLIMRALTSGPPFWPLTGRNHGPGLKERLRPATSRSPHGGPATRGRRHDGAGRPLVLRAPARSFDPVRYGDVGALLVLRAATTPR